LGDALRSDGKLVDGVRLALWVVVLIVVAAFFALLALGVSYLLK
jgi:hypothetical protein